MKNCIFVFFMMLVMGDSLLASDVHYEKINACLSSKNGKCLIEVSRYESQLHGPIDEIGASDRADEISLLVQYYDHARKNQVSNILSLFAKSDGSLDSKKAEIHKDPYLYAQFYKLGRVDVNRAVAFDKYRMLGVVWHDINGNKLADWTELLLCDGACELSNMMMAGDAAIDFMTIIASGSEYNGVAADGVAIEQGAGGQYPGMITFTVIQAEDKKRLIKTSESLVALYGSSKENIKVAQTNREQLVDNVLSIFDGVWANAQENVYTLLPVKNLEGAVFVASNLMVLSSFFSSLDSIYVVAVIPSASVDYVIYQGKKDNADYYGFFPIGGDGKIVTLADLDINESVVAQALQNPIIFRSLVKGLNQEPVEVTPEDTDRFKIQKLHGNEAVQSDKKVNVPHWKWILLSLLLMIALYTLVKRTKK